MESFLISFPAKGEISIQRQYNLEPSSSGFKQMNMSKNMKRESGRFHKKRHAVYIELFTVILCVPNLILMYLQDVPK